MSPLRDGFFVSDQNERINCSDSVRSTRPPADARAHASPGTLPSRRSALRAPTKAASTHRALASRIFSVFRASLVRGPGTAPL